MKRKYFDPRTPTFLFRVAVAPMRSKFADVLRVAIFQHNKRRSGAHLALQIDQHSTAEEIAEAFTEMASMIRKNIRKRAKR